MCFYALFSFQRVRVYVRKFCGAAALCAWFTCCGSVHLFTICAPRMVHPLRLSRSVSPPSVQMYYF